jgi:hypothetical protein
LARSRWGGPPPRDLRELLRSIDDDRWGHERSETAGSRRGRLPSGPHMPVIAARDTVRVGGCSVGQLRQWEVFRARGGRVRLAGGPRMAVDCTRVGA